MGYNLAFVKKTAIKIFSKVPFTIKVSAMTTWPGNAKPIKVDKKLCIAFSPEFLKRAPKAKKLAARLIPGIPSAAKHPFLKLLSKVLFIN
jgi:hypothetical protein